jgi:hypothetical protein
MCTIHRRGTPFCRLPWDLCLEWQGCLSTAPHPRHMESHSPRQGSMAGVSLKHSRELPAILQLKIPMRHRKGLWHSQSPVPCTPPVPLNLVKHFSIRQPGRAHLVTAHLDGVICPGSACLSPRWEIRNVQGKGSLPLPHVHFKQAGNLLAARLQAGTCSVLQALSFTFSSRC